MQALFFRILVVPKKSLTVKSWKRAFFESRRIFQQGVLVQQLHQGFSVEEYQQADELRSSKVLYHHPKRCSEFRWRRMACIRSFRCEVTFRATFDRAKTSN